ncbi:hormogonium polysaccharide biosynthesis protein HpsA [Candidatus Synechococcus calcipolaris G9]|uniref:Hormogonium polysaccharide biosynthesis protein HpsA n=1 Tax=Candidatus Synechococcus calcipolaris G9 TaxID=1497997 RepID=A0ABT6EZC1_9SYNE|nr:hormogonium polysaccharide biosynthesis protein HpsA [Candidatus Synechococcus calcipolaris]MDG2990921.1 hormogonium polysaccharide biosynthesis protein HpsA [Candidatus Synechococcus calcipolaris G9]
MTKRYNRFGLNKRTYRKLLSTIRHLFRQLSRWLRRKLKAAQGRPGNPAERLRLGRSGFVLPTAVLVVLVLTMTVGALTMRTLNRTTQVAGERQDVQVLNAATPALDRAKAKLEYLFSRDPRFPNGVPGEDRLRELMLNADLEDDVADPYTLDDEERIDLDGDGTVDNAWYFQPSANSIVAYSVLMQRPTDAQLNQTDAQKAAALVTRNRPLNTTDESGVCSAALGDVAGGGAEAGWDPITSAVLRKNVQIDAFVFENRGGGQALATIDLIQERELARGNKWGAWFRNDLEVFPGPAFRWNGAIHTEGSMIVGDSSQFQAYLVSAPSSCIYTASSSEITVTQLDNEPGQGDGPIAFQGQFINGSMKLNTFTGSSTYHVYRQPPEDPVTAGDAAPPAENVIMNTDRDSVASGVTAVNALALNPVLLQTQDISRARNASNPSNSGDTVRDENWDNQFYVQRSRLFNAPEPKPYIDDTYRADDRYGPKPVYDRNLDNPDPNLVIPSGSVVGDAIPAANLVLNRNNPPANEPKEQLGLDGYWERRARQEGLRILVGERLELGKPLDPPNAYVTNPRRGSEYYQHRALRDDLAAVQSTAIYHYKAEGTSINNGIADPLTPTYPGNTTGGFAPVSCLASTYHSGTSQSALRSVTFNQYAGVTGAPDVFLDFFTGRGTNGWEYTPVDPASPDMQSALENLVAYSADNTALGAFPPRQEAGVIHPNPATTRSGNFSNLARALDSTLGNTSLADISFQQTAACTLGMLADSVEKLQDTDFYANLDPTGTGNLNNLNNALADLSDLDIDDGEVDVFRETATTSRVQLIRPGFGVAAPLTMTGGYTPPDSYVTGLIPNASWAARPLQELPADVNAKLARLVALREQAIFDLDPANYTCGIPGTYPLLQARFCLLRRGATTAAAFTIPAVGDTTPAINIEDPATYDFLLGAGDVGASVYIAGAGQFTLASVTDVGGRVTQVTLTNPNPAVAGNAPDGTPIPAGAAISLHLPTVTGTVSDDNTISDDPPNLDRTTPANSSEIDDLEIGTMVLAEDDIVELRSATGPLFGRFLVTDFNAGSNNEVDLRYLGGFDPAAGDEIDVGATIVRLGSITEPLAGTFNTVVKYPALAAIFNGPNTVAPADIAATPKDSLADFVVPVAAVTGNTTGFPNRFNQIIDFGGAAHNIAFLDTAIFNGREEMDVRVMDLDIDLLRTTAIGGDTWLPMGGIVYGAREDAVREDGIARPVVSGSNWMNPDPAGPHDPALSPPFNISIKPVDFFADPMRRPHGFRFLNGVRVDRTGLTAVQNIYGMSFISDNSAYIQGDFNWHSTNGSTTDGNRIEEFTVRLPNDFNPAQFYGRTTLDARFGRPETDTWRPVEILADAVSVVSDNYCPGSANDYFAEAYNDDIVGLGNVSPENVVNNYPNANTANNERVNNNNAANRIYLRCGNASNNLRTSYLNANRPRDNQANPAIPADHIWLRENPFDPSTPVFVDRNGTPQIINHLTGQQGNYTGVNANSAYYAFNQGRSRAGTSNTRVNAVMVSGTVPSRPRQSYGGMHNFPRFLEGWGNLWIQGSFLQLNFSTQATAPFDQDQWDMPATAIPADTAFNDTTAPQAELIQYYGAPARRWGYDPALQLAPAGPVANRFISVGRARSEYFTELPADDPYILNLRCAERDGGGTIDPSVTGCPA